MIHLYDTLEVCFKGPSTANPYQDVALHAFFKQGNRQLRVRGGYGGHGETYTHPEDVIWWAKGGTLHGESWKRIGFLHNLLKEDNLLGLEPFGTSDDWPWSRVSGARDLGGRVSFLYFGEHQPDQWTTGLPTDHDNYEVDIIDTWNMSIVPAQKIPPLYQHPTRHGDRILGGKADAAFGIALPGKPYMAVRIRKIEA